MAQQLLWVDSIADQDSRTLARQREARIRSHAQCHRRKHVAESKDDDQVLEGDRTKSLQPSDCVDGLPASSLRPSRSLGRLASARKRKQKTKDAAKASVSQGTGPRRSQVALAKSLPWLWHGLSSSERRSLAFFELRTSQEWSGWEDTHFWNNLALQVSQQSHAVARSLIAVSAHHECMEAVGSVERMRLQALSCAQSSKATKSLLARSDMAYFEALVSCLIMICYHGLQHSQASFTLLRSGVKLLSECNEPGRASAEERRTINTQLRPLFDRLLFRPCGMVAMHRAFALSVKRHRARSLTVLQEMPDVPATFDTLSEARLYLRKILDWAHDTVPADPTASIDIFLAAFYQLRDVWEAALAHSEFPKTATTMRSRKLLRAACLVGIIIVETAHLMEEIVSDKYQAEFTEILSLVEGARSSGHSFGIDAGLIDIISFVGSECRDPHTRRRALRLLKSGGRVEGDRIASNPATILEALIAMEERNLKVTSCHDVPEQNRRRLLYGQQYISQGRIDLFCASADGSIKERCSVSLAGATNGKSNKKFAVDGTVPDAIFGTGYAAYLEDRQTMSYFRLELDRFYFPIPKV